MKHPTSERGGDRLRLSIVQKTPANLLNQTITLSVAAHRQKTNLSEPMNSLAHLRINSSSVAYKGAECVPDVMADHKISHFVLFSRLVIDDDKMRSCIFRHQWKTGCRPDNQRRADHNK